MKTIHLDLIAILALFLVLVPSGGLRAAPGDLVPGFDAGLNGSVRTAALQPDGKIVIGGNWGSLRTGTANQTDRPRLARLNPDGSPDAVFYPNPTDGQPYAIAVLEDGKILVAGDFSHLQPGGTGTIYQRNYLVRLNADGTVDESFNADGTMVNGLVQCILPQPDGRILISGQFNTVNGETRTRIARLETDGNLDPTFNCVVGGAEVSSMALDAQSRILIASYSLYQVGGQNRPYLTRIQPNGDLDLDFSAEPGGTAYLGPVYSISVLRSGKILIGGGFSLADGTVQNLARLDEDGTLDAGFAPNPNSSVFGTTVLADGSIIVCGSFTQFGEGTQRERIARVLADGSLDSFDPHLAGNEATHALIQGDGRLLIAGAFSQVGSASPQTRQGLAELEKFPETGSLLGVYTGGWIKWARGDGLAEPSKVRFDFSTDGGTTWTPAGAGVRVTGGWDLSDAPVPPAGKIRARARFSDPYYGSSSLLESVNDYVMPASVPGSANIWLAGHPDGTTAANTDSAPAASPLLAPITPVPGKDVVFEVSGGTHNGPIGPGSTGPEGGGGITHEAENSIAELKAPINALVGVFLDADAPSGDAPPPLADFTVAENRDYDLLIPALRQPFFIGDGRTGEDAVQRVRIPAGATRLFLGSLDQFDNAENFGSFAVTATVADPLQDLALEFSDFQIANGEFGEDWTFEITQDPENPARTLRVQSMLPGGQWADLPGGGAMTPGAGGVWSLTTTNIPLGDGRSFRVLAEADGYAATPFTQATPMTYDVRHPAGRILYTRGSFGATELVLMQPDGSEKVVLTDNSFAPLRCALSPDGTKIAFTTLAGGLWVMKAEPMHASNNVPVNVLDGSDAAVLFNAVPSWAPDGMNIAFADTSSHIQVIEAVDANGDPEPYDFSTNPLIDVYTSNSGQPNVAWSPDGKYLAVTEGSIIQAFQIADGSGAITPATAPATFTVTNPGDFATQKVSVAWSPDGERIAFVQKTGGGDTNVALLTARNSAGAVTPESATNQRELLNTDAETVSWSPDGSLLALEKKTNGPHFIEVILPEPYDATTNPGMVLTSAVQGGDAFQPSFRQPVGSGSGSGQFVAFESPVYAGNEDGDPIVVRVVRAGGSTGTLTVDFSVTGGTADEGLDAESLDADFFLSESPLVFADGETVKEILVTPINDGEEEDDETLILELGEPDNGSLGAISSTTVTIADNETNTQPFTPAASELAVAINGKLQKSGKGKAKTGDLFKFTARQTQGAQLPGLLVKIQATTTPNDAGSWVNLDEGTLSRANTTSFTWVGSTRKIPAGKVYFRTRSSADVRRSNAGPVVGPFTVTPAPVLDLRVTAASNSDPGGTTVKPGEFLTYTLRCRNIGAAPATKVVLNSLIPQKTRFDSASHANVPGYFVQEISRKGVLTDVLWNVGNLAAGAEVTEVVTVQVDQTVPFDWIILNNRLTYSMKGLKETVLSAIRTDVAAPIRVTVAKDKSVVVAGDLITYTLTIHNDAAFTVTGGKVTDQIPAGTRLVSYANGDGTGNYLGLALGADGLSATPNGLSQPGFTPHNGMLTWNVGDLASGASRMLRFTVRVSYDLFEKLARNGESFDVQIQNLNFDFIATPPSGGTIAARGGVIPGSEIARTFVSAGYPASRPQLGLRKVAMSDAWTTLGNKDIAGVFEDGDRVIEYEIGAWNYGNIAAQQTVITDGIPFETELFLDTPAVYDFDAFMARFTLDGNPVTSSAGFTFYDENGNVLSAGGEPFQDKNHNGKVEKGEFLDQNSNGKYDGPDKIRRFDYALGTLAPMANPAVKTLSYRVRLAPKVKRYEYITAFSAAKHARGEGLKLTCPDFFYPVFGSPDLLFSRVIRKVELVVDEPVYRVGRIIGDRADTGTVACDLRVTNTGDLSAIDAKLRVPIPAGFTTTSAPVEKRNAKYDIAIPGSSGTAVFDLGQIAPNQTVTRQVVLQLTTPILPALLDKKGALKLNAVPVVPVAASTKASSAAAPQALVSRAATSAPLSIAFEAVAGNFAAIPFSKSAADPYFFIGRIAPASVQAETEMEMIIFYGNTGQTAATKGEIGIKIPDGTRFVSADPIAYNPEELFPREYTVDFNAGYVKIDQIKGKRARPEDGTIDVVRWNIGNVSSGEVGAVKLRLFVNKSFPGTALTEKSCYLKFANAPGKSAGPLTIQVRRDTSGAVDVWQGIGNFFEGLGSALEATLRTLFGGHSGQVKTGSQVIGLGGADYVQLTNGTVVIPLGRAPATPLGSGRSAIIAPYAALAPNVPRHSFLFTTGGSDSLALAAGETRNQQVFVPGSINAPRNVENLLATIVDPVNSIVAAGGGNIVAAGGGNIVAAGGGNIVAGGGGNAISNDGAGVILGPVQFAIPGVTPGIVAAGGGNIVAAGGGNIVAAGGGNIVAAGGGNIVAGGGGNVVELDGKKFSADQMATLVSKLVDFDGASLTDPKVLQLIGLDGASLIGQDGAGLIGLDGASLIGQDGAGFFPK